MSQFVFKMPDLGEGTVEAEIVAWHTRPGDSVNEDQVIVEVMTDKAAVEVPAPVSGRVVSITGEPGDKVAVGSPLIVFELAAAVPTGEGSSAAASGMLAAGADAGGSAVAASGGPATAMPIAAARDGAAKASSMVVRAAEGVPAEVASDGSATAPPARYSAVLAKDAWAPGASANEGQAATSAVANGRGVAASGGSDSPMTAAAQEGAATAALAASAGIEHSTASVAGQEPAASTNEEQQVTTRAATARADAAAAPSLAGGRVKASPANRRRAREAGIDLTTIAGSGPGGRILTGDLVGESAAERSGTRSNVSAETSSVRQTVADTSEIKVIGLRRLIAERMSAAKRNIPHFAYVEEVDVTELESLRVHLNGALPREAPSLTYLPLVVMALTRALASFPQCNVRYDAAREVLVRYRAVHVGVATQTPDGLKVPVVRNAQALSLWDLAAEIRRVAERARSNKATRDELVGSTITVTSLGKLGGIASTPVINAPEVAIIGLNKAVERPVVYGGAVAVRRIMNLSSSFDHRFVDGYDAAAMIQVLKELLEHPATIFIPKVTTS